MMVPYVAFGKDEIDKMKRIGTEAKCPNCKKKHPVEYGKDTEGKETTLLGFVECDKDGATYLVAIEGKEIDS